MILRAWGILRRHLIHILLDIIPKRVKQETERFFQAHRLLNCRDPRQKALRRENRALPVTGQVCRSPEDVAGSREPVAPGSPHFLVIGFHLLRGAVVDNQPDIGLVDAHSKRHRSHNTLQNRSRVPSSDPEEHAWGNAHTLGVNLLPQTPSSA